MILAISIVGLVIDHREADTQDHEQGQIPQLFQIRENVPYIEVCFIVSSFVQIQGCLQFSELHKTKHQFTGYEVDKTFQLICWESRGFSHISSSSPKFSKSRRWIIILFHSQYIDATSLSEATIWGEARPHDTWFDISPSSGSVSYALFLSSN